MLRLQEIREDHQHVTELLGLNIMETQLDGGKTRTRHTTKTPPQKHDQGGMMKKCIWP